MSDPIRSISQNNFILADQKEVSHDNTLSGNGTPESPLGVNETVLWTGELGATGTDIQLSESINKFQRARFYGLAKTNSLGRCTVTCEVELTLKEGSPIGLAYFPLYDRSAGVTNMNMMYVQIYDATTISLLAGSKWRDGTYTNNISTYDFNLVKVVGINRIANN